MRSFSPVSTPIPFPLPTIHLMWAKRHEWRQGESQVDLATPAYALWFVERGEIDLRFRSGPPGAYPRHWRVRAGMLFLAPEPTIRDIEAVGDEGASWLSLGLRLSGPGPYLASTHLLTQLASVPCGWEPNESERDTIAAWMRCLIETWGLEESGPLPDTAGSLLCQGMALAILAVLWRMRHGEKLLISSASANLPPYLVRDLAAIETDPVISLEELIRLSGVSAGQFRRVFARHLSLAPSHYLKERRLEKARHLLASTEMTVAEIAGIVGFESQSHLTRCYAAVFGLPPAAHRRALRNTGI